MALSAMRSVTLQVLGDIHNVEAKLSWVNAQADDIDKRNPTMVIGASISDPEAKLGILSAALATLTDHLYDVKIGADDTIAQATVAKWFIELEALQKVGNNALQGVRITDTQYAATLAKITSLDTALGGLAKKQQAAALAQLPADLAAGGGGGGYGYAGLLSGSSGLFAGALGTGHVGTVQNWHLVLDAIGETAAILGPATLALVIYGAALAATGPDLDTIYQRETNMYIATDILGQKMPGLTGSLNKLSSAIKPGVFEVWGDALTIVNGQAGSFTKIVETAVDWVDRFAARITVDVGNSTGMFNTLLAAGTRDLNLLGSVFGNIGDILGRIFQVAMVTHVAEDLLSVVAAITKVAAGILKLTPIPLLAVALAAHSIWLWGGKLVQLTPGASKLVSIFEGIAAKSLSASSGLEYTVRGMNGVAVAEDGTITKTGFFKTALAGLSEVPVWGWVAAGSLALAGLGFWLASSKDATTKWIDALNSGISSASNDNAFALMAKDAGLANAKVTQAGQGVTTAVRAINTATGGSKFSMEEYSSSFTQAVGKQQAFAGESQAVVSKMGTFSKSVLWIMQTFKVSYPQALGIADQANVNLSQGILGTSKAAQTARQEITGLMAGFTQLQTPAGVAGTDFEALAYASNDITTKIQSLNSAWSSWMGSVTGSQTAFDTVAQGMDTLTNSATTFEYHLGTLILKGSTGTAGIDSLKEAGVNLNQGFMTEVGNLDDLIGSLRTANASQADQTSAVKASVAALLPYAKGSTEATATLYAMAQQADYTGNVSIAGLTAWAGIKAPAALGVLKKDADQATTAASNLANTIQNLLNVSFQNDVIQSSGASKALAKYTQDLVNNTQNSQGGQSARAQLIADLRKAGLTAQQATTYVNGLSTSLNKIPKIETPVIKMTGKGTYTITGAAGPDLGIAVPYQPLIHPAAAGLMVSGGIPGVDSVHILAQRGEAVVPRHLVPAVAPLLHAGGVPGFASGGYVGGVPGLGTFTTQMFTTFQNDITKAMVSGMQNAVTAAASASVAAGIGPVSANASAAQSYASSRLSAFNWGQNQMPALIALWDQESGWNRLAYNASSGATGIPQSLPYTKMPKAAWLPSQGGQGSASAQIDWGLNYIRSTYGSPAGAESHEQSFHWYDQGGLLPQGLSLAANNTGAPELVTPLRNLAHSGAGAQGGNIYITVAAGDCIDPNAVALAIHQKLRRLKTKLGGQSLGLD